MGPSSCSAPPAARPSPRTALEAFLRDSPAPRLYLASASSKALEFAEVTTVLEQASRDPAAATALAGPGGSVTALLDPQIGLRYRITSAPRSTGQPGAGNGVQAVKEVVLLGQGYPVIFYPPDTHGAPNRAMDPVMTQLFLAAAGLPAAAALLAQRVYDLDALREQTPARWPAPWQDLLDEQALLAAWCAANHLDWHTYRRLIGFTPAPVHGLGDHEEQR